MNFAAAERIARALLYEGYLLYPYRSSAPKNQRRWTFGCLFPPSLPQSNGSAEGSEIQTEVLLRGDDKTTVEVEARFLQMMPGSAEYEVAERRVATASQNLLQLVHREHRLGFAFPPVEGVIDASAQPVGDNLFKLRVQLRNFTPLANGDQFTREEALPWALLSTHLLLGAQGGRFLSNQDPPGMVRDLTVGCRNVRVWPILVGDPDRRDMMLGAPIILPDFPQVAAESQGDLFDGTEMDEMLTLRIRTLTPNEKSEMSATDPRADLLLRRSEELDDEQLLKLHGTWRRDDDAPTPIAQVRVGDVDIAPGMRVRLRPRGNADVFDLALAGMTAMVVSIEQDFEDQIYVSVVIDDDPGRDFGVAGKPGHRFHFQPQEVEPIEDSNSLK